MVKIKGIFKILSVTRRLLLFPIGQNITGGHQKTFKEFFVNVTSQCIN